MEVALQTEPHLLAGTVNPTVGKRNVTLPIDNGLNLVEWRQRKEQARGQVTVFGRRLRVSKPRAGPAVVWGLSLWRWLGRGRGWGGGAGLENERTRTNLQNRVPFLTLALGEKVSWALCKRGKVK